MKHLNPFLILAAAGLAIPNTALADGQIVGGETTTGYPAVVALMYGDWPGCTGTLITPRVVLTAAHCVDGVSGPVTTVYFGNTPAVAGSGQEVPAEGQGWHSAWAGEPSLNTPGPNYDIGAVFLSADAPVAPMAILQTPPAVGAIVTEVGFGITQGTGGDGHKKVATMSVSALEPDVMMVDPVSGGTCNGDSGGPAFLDGPSGPVIVGITSFGPADCWLGGGNTRADVYWDWLDANVGPLIVPVVNIDNDGDGFPAADDCNDSDASIHPGAPESCDAIDSDCDGDRADGFGDLDGDGLPYCVDVDDYTLEVIECGDTVTRSAFVQHFYEVEVLEGESLSAQLQWNDGADLDLFLFEVDGQGLLQAVDWSLEGRPEQVAAEELDAGEYYLLVYPYPDQPLSAPVTFELDTECWTEPVIVDGPDGRRPVRPVLSCSFRGGSSASTSRGLALLLVAALLRRRRS